MQIEFLCSNCGKSHMTRPMVGIPHGMFLLGYRAVGDAFYCNNCVRTWKERNGKEFDEQYPDAPLMFAMLWNKTVKQAVEEEGRPLKKYREAANGDFVEVSEDA